MKIRELRIYGYGQFTNRHIVLENAPAALFYGQNEAGKSTIMSFIHSILFGLPQKLQTDSKYEPKDGQVFGGAIIAEVSGSGLVKIERVRGRSGGEARIDLPDGKTAGEALLREWTGGMDKAFFQSVFSFDLHGLQQIERLNEEEIGKFLYVTSMVGTDAIYKLEQRLGKEQDRLFKPNGKKPVLNEKLAKVKKTADAVKAAAQAASEYQPLIKQKEDAEKEVLQLEFDLREGRKKHSYLSRAVSYLPLLRDQKVLGEELESLPDTSRFPADGMNRLEKLLTEIEPLKAQTERLREQIQQLKEKSEAFKANGNILEKEAHIVELKEQSGRYQALIDERSALESAIQVLDEELAVLAGQVYENPPSQEEICRIDTTIKMKSAIADLTEEAKTLSMQKKQLDEQFDRAKEALDISENRHASLLEKGMDQDERTALEQELSNLEKADNHQQTGQLKKELENMKLELENQRKRSDNSKKRSSASLMFVLLIAAAGCIWSVIQQQWVLGGLLFTGLAAGVLFFRSLQTDRDPLLEHLRKRKRDLEQELQEQTDPSPIVLQRLEELRGILWKDEQIKQMAELEKLRTEQETRVCDRVIAKYEEWEKERFQLDHKVKPVLKAFYLPETAPASSLAESLAILEKYKEKISEKRRKEEHKQSGLSDTAQYEQKAASSLNLAGASGNGLLIQIDELYSDLIQEREKARKLEDLDLRLNELSGEYEERLLLLNNKNEAYRKLLEMASASDEEAFRSIAIQHGKREEIKKQLTWTSRQLQTSNITQSLAEDWTTLEDELAKVTLHIEELEKQLKSRQEQVSFLQAKLEALEADGSYSDHLHLHELQKEEARRTAREWMIHTLARDFLLRTIDYHRTVRMPKLLEKTVHFFTSITDGRYVNVYLPDHEQTFIAERADGQRFNAGELSQATSEQLYLSLRLALISSLNESLNMPVLIDDGFVHFDAKRTDKMLGILRDISVEQQVLMFTCQTQLANQFLGPVTVLERQGLLGERKETV
ncbi:AAA family ATPase [Metabacillus sp. KIGAM252]|uniref:AAA family ATPase n=1 Tax=Metabacillus flavus TaxID=2823519 RepID=A0ABS5LBY5_9BACI|nr:AAA family ATPase [Metabacillus flavus]MBS2968245.1 AAA family ATPase [Metabacillus flavus]